jgi:hypothetical protein
MREPNAPRRVRLPVDFRQALRVLGYTELIEPVRAPAAARPPVGAVDAPDGQFYRIAAGRKSLPEGALVVHRPRGGGELAECHASPGGQVHFIARLNEPARQCKPCIRSLIVPCPRDEMPAFPDLPICLKDTEQEPAATGLSIACRTYLPKTEPANSGCAAVQPRWQAQTVGAPLRGCSENPPKNSPMQ